ncbi:putative nicotinamide N-methyltransferase-like protein [Tritrichomonas foetus]|uniref:Nicotinamide N-methyltransferase-like protein n=1 Tax=Tritrichomonas foetus TaxID=1144522 RepID=A0A1J4JJT1_9EUKA|nr:putative nicotinamide N-methyltransferase-like protein [Tritrichomonas foetus]|eukprot:OHS98865.1 putative nicotinamide N-methyltransferase-like protein [Tritrichomonas foetus]
MANTHGNIKENSIEEDQIDDTQNGADMFDLFFDREYVKQEIELPSGRKMSFLGLKTAMTDPDLTGQILWPGCSLLMNWLDRNINIFSQKSAVEVGAGTGICASFVAKYGNTQKVIATDGSEPVVELMQNNIDLHLDNSNTENAANDKTQNKLNLTCELLKWEEDAYSEFVKKNGQFDYVFGSEIAYNENCVEGLVNTVNALLKPSGQFIVGHIDRYAQTTRAFFNKLERTGFVKVAEDKWDDIMNYKMDMIVGSVYTFQRK